MEKRSPDSEVRLQIRQIGTPVNAPGLKNIVVLGDDFDRELYIEIGLCEAMAILRRLEADSLPAQEQSYAHDLLLGICQTFGAKVEKIVIDDLWNKTYYAKLYLSINGETICLDARPSDSIALALRAEAPLYASEAVMASAARSDEE